MKIKNILIAIISILFLGNNNISGVNPILISEVFYDSPLNESHEISTSTGIAHHNGEFIELFNPTLNDIDLKNWKLSDSNRTYYFPENAIIPARSTIIIAYRYPNSGFVLSSLFPSINSIPETGRVFYQSDIELSNNGEYIRLINPTGTTVDQMSYKYPTVSGAKADFWNISASNFKWREQIERNYYSLQRTEFQYANNVFVPTAAYYSALSASPLTIPSVISFQTINEIVYQTDYTDINADQPVFNKNLPVGTIPGEFNVSSDGAATYQIPVEVPSGINGMQPEVSIFYNSQAGDGVCGKGAAIGGLSSITIANQNLFSDNKISGISIANNVYYYDGNRLHLKTSETISEESNSEILDLYPDEDDMYNLYERIFNGIPKNQTSTFSAENESYTLIETTGVVPYIYAQLHKKEVDNVMKWEVRWSVNNTIPRMFTVTNKDGVRIELTLKNDIRYFTKENIKELNAEWVISKVTDTNGNYITYEYDKNEEQTIIKKISYNANGENLPTESINFGYKVKSVVAGKNFGDMYRENKFLLDNIEVKSGDVRLKRYDFKYAECRNTYYLRSVTLTGRNDVKLNSTVFNWGNENTVINSTAVNTPVSSNVYVGNAEKYWLSADVTGDGIDDMINVYPKKIYDHYGNVTEIKNYVEVSKTNVSGGQISFSNLATYDIGNPFDYTKIKSTNPNILFGDVNGDGKKEIIVVQMSPVNVKKVRFSVLGGSTYEIDLNYSAELPLVAVRDVNNDGIDEIICFEKANIITSTSEEGYYGNHFIGKICYSQPGNVNSKYWVDIVKSNGFLKGIPNSMKCDDFNNDGLYDLFFTTGEGSVSFINTGSKTDHPDQISFSVESNKYENNKNAVIETGDFDNDGQKDILSISEYPAALNVILYKNNEFVTNPFSESNLTARIEDYLITDFNHDGKSDVILVTKYYSNTGAFVKTMLSWYSSTGSGFKTDRTFISKDQDFSLRKYNCTGDFDGDGKEDVLSYGSDIYNGWYRMDKVFIAGSFNNNFEERRVKSITNGMGKTLQISYQPLTFNSTPEGKSFYTKGNSSIYPLADLQAPIYCVSKVRSANANGGLSSTDYSYDQARVQLTGRGNLGFKSMTINNETANRKVVSTTEMNPVLCMPDNVTTTVYTADGTKAISQSSTSFNNSRNDKIFKSELQSTQESDYLNNLSTSTLYKAYDDFGNPTTIETTQGNVKTTQTITYQTRGGWCPDKPENVTVKKDNGTDTFTKLTNYTYDATTGNLTKIIQDTGDENQKTTEYKDWTVFGQPTTTEVTANGITRTGKVTISNSGRFIESSTNLTGQTTTYTWDEANALLMYENNRLGTTSFTYNDFGKLTRTDFADGTYTENIAHWAPDQNQYGALFSVIQNRSGLAPVTHWFDNQQNEKVTETYGFDNKKTTLFTEYLANGNTYRVSAPTFGSQPEAWDAVYDYYSDGRIKSVETPLGKTTTEYNGTTTNVTAPDGSKSTTLNGTGQVAASTINGKTVTYEYYASGLTHSITPEGGQAVTMEYDKQGNRTKLTDPDTGITTDKYTGFGELDWEEITGKDGTVVTTDYTYYPLTGLLDTRTCNNETTTYGYDALYRLETIEIPGKHKQTFTYGSFDRISAVTELIEGNKTLVKGIGYDGFGRVNSETFNSGYYVENHYDDYGNLTSVTDKYNRTIWEAKEANVRGQITKVMKGTKETIYGYDDSKGLLMSMMAPDVVSYGYTYDTQNKLEYKTDYRINQKEHYTYDAQNRLTNWDILNATSNVCLKANSATYDVPGNIKSKSDLNVPNDVTLNYEQISKPHKLTSISGVTNAIPNEDLSITYTDFRKVKTLTEGSKTYDISYGVDEQRRKTVYKENGVTKLTRYYLGDYEEESDTLGNIKKYHYLSGGTVMINNNGVETLYYGYTDFQGSLVALTDENGTVVERYAYDPWGSRRNPDNWTLPGSPPIGDLGGLNRGYTGHEHLDAFGIINMNGRVYDPATAQFFSPDPFVQSPGDWQNYNRYAYCLNNPVMYTDPSGYQYDYMEPEPVELRQTEMPGNRDTGFRNNFNYWSAHQGSISYNDDGKFYYSGGAEASWGEARGYLFSGSHVYYYSQGQQAIDYYKTTPFYLNGRGKAEATLKRQLANIDASGKEIISTIPTGIDIMVSLSQEFTKINPGNFVITTVNGAQIVMNTNQVLMGLEFAAKNTLVLGIGIEAIMAVSGNKGAQQNFWSDSMVSIALYTISVAGCGVPALVLGIGWVMYRNGAFDGMFDIKYHQIDYIPKATPQDAIRAQYQFKDRYQPIYFHY